MECHHRNGARPSGPDRKKTNRKFQLDVRKNNEQIVTECLSGLVGEMTRDGGIPRRLRRMAYGWRTGRRPAWKLQAIRGTCSGKRSRCNRADAQWAANTFHRTLPGENAMEGCPMPRHHPTAIFSTRVLIYLRSGVPPVGSVTFGGMSSPGTLIPPSSGNLGSPSRPRR